jgi:hypothetical protein
VSAVQVEDSSEFGCDWDMPHQAAYLVGWQVEGVRHREPDSAKQVVSAEAVVVPHLHHHLRPTYTAEEKHTHSGSRKLCFAERRPLHGGLTLGAIRGGSMSACSFRVWYQMGLVVVGRMLVLATEPPNRATT